MSNITVTSPTLTTNINNLLAQQVLEEAIRKGVKEFCVASASRNASLVYALANTPEIKTYYWSEERSAAFFALGRAKATGCPVALVTTSGTAAAEALPAVMTAHYWGIPLLLITADRPRRYRGSGAPQTAEQVGLYSYYVQYEQDLALKEKCCLQKWAGTAPAHLNVCLEEPSDFEAKCSRIDHMTSGTFAPCKAILREESKDAFLKFISSTKNPFVVLGSLPESQRNSAIEFLLHLGAPLYLEGFSGLREEERLGNLRISSIDKVWNRSANHHYQIDGILRIGSIPTGRLWRDLEDKASYVQVFSVSHLPFSGLSHGDIHHCELEDFFSWAQSLPKKGYRFTDWQQSDLLFQKCLQQLYKEIPQAEASQVHQLSKIIPRGSYIFLGNSLPVREWDSAATFQSRDYEVDAVRGVNGIDGQISTFLGSCQPDRDNWAIIGDLTALYDMTGPWIFDQLTDISANIVIVNNSGGQIFANMYSHESFLSRHNLNFEPLARMWNWQYERWTSVPEKITPCKGGRIIELVPDNSATNFLTHKVNNYDYMGAFRIPWTSI